MNSERHCDICETSLTGGVDTFGSIGSSLCYRCYYEQIQPEPTLVSHISKKIFRKSTYHEQDGQAKLQPLPVKNINSHIEKQQTEQRDFVPQLERLAQMHREGILSESEFMQAKVKILMIME